jgi:TonB family protein
MRRKLAPMAYVELGPDNGGILLNLSEGGIAVQSALALTDREFPELRFQVPSLQGWLRAKGRIVWMSDSKKEAGIQFTELHGTSREEIQKWVSAGDAPEQRIAPPRTPAPKPSVAPPVPSFSPVTRPPAPIARPAEERGVRQGVPDRQRVPDHVRQQVPAAVRPPAVRASGPANSTQQLRQPTNPSAANPTPGAAANTAQPVRDRASATQQVREPAPATERQTAVGAAVAEPPAQDFRFTDYSMFAPAPEEEAWSQPTRHKGNWQRVALGILVAALFFALGATVGRESVDRWVTHLQSWIQGQLGTAPRTGSTAPSRSEQKGAGLVDATAKDNRGTNDSVGGREDQTTVDNRGPKPEASAPEARSNSGKPVEEDRSGIPAPAPAAKAAAPPTAGSAGQGEAGGSTPRGTKAPGANEMRSRPSVESEVAGNGRGVEGEPGRSATDHAILVNAPEPGSRPFFVNLPGEAISASPSVAISARRSLEILPRRSAADSGSQRVVIGKLISHSEPFYPAEARKRGIEGSVELRARIGRTGQVIEVSPVSGPWLLFPAAVTAVREWRYEPTFVNGDPAETLADITIVFRLH